MKSSILPHVGVCELAPRGAQQHEHRNHMTLQLSSDTPCGLAWAHHDFRMLMAFIRDANVVAFTLVAFTQQWPEHDHDRRHADFVSY